jgi:hypothetical protein
MRLSDFQANLKKLKDSGLPDDALYAYMDETLEFDLELFCLVMLPHLFFRPFGDIHRELFDLLVSDNKYAVVAYPRKHGKTTCLKGFILWSIIYKKFNYIMWVGATFTDIQRHYVNVKKEFESNGLLRAVYGDLENESIKWNEEEIYLKNGFHLVIKSAGQSFRGALDDVPPDLILFDDLDDDELVKSKTNRDKLNDWMFNNAIPSMDVIKGKSRAIGTIFHEDGQLSRLIQNPAWVSIVYSGIVDEGLPTEHALCESVFPLAALKAKKSELFNAKPVPMVTTWWNEYMNQPNNIDTKKWPTENLHNDQWQGRYENGYLIRMVGEKEIRTPCLTFTAVDIASANGKARSDSTTVLTCAITPDWHIWSLEVYKRQNSQPSETVKEIFRQHALYNTIHVFLEEIGVADMIQETYDKEASKHQTRPMLDAIKSRGKVAKLDRIMWALQDRLRTRQVHIREGHMDLFEQLKNPKGAHDDLLDNLADIATRGYAPDGDMPEEESAIPWELRSQEDTDGETKDAVHSVFDY